MPGLAAPPRQNPREKLQKWRDSKGKQPERHPDNDHNDINHAPHASRIQLDDLLRDAVLLLQGFDAKHARFHIGNDSTNTRNSRRPPLERYDENEEQLAPGQLVFIEIQVDLCANNACLRSS